MKLATLFCAVSAAVTAVAPSASAGLLHRYSFNDGTANDSVGGAHGTLVRGAAVTGGQVVFDPVVNNGTNKDPLTGQYVDLPDGLVKHRRFTIEAWYTERGGSPWQRVFDFGNNSQYRELLPSDTTAGTQGKGFVMLTRNSVGDLLVQVSRDSWGGADTNYLAKNDTVTLGIERHLVFTYDPDAGLLRLYINGSFVGSAVADEDLSTITYLNSWLGRSQFSNDPFFNGTINEFRIYNDALTAQHVSTNFANGADGDAVPEPTAVAVLASAVAAAGLTRRRRKLPQ